MCLGESMAIRWIFRQVTGEMPLEQVSGLRVRVEVPLQRPGSIERSGGLRRHRIDLRHRTAQEKRGAHDLP